MMTRSMITLGMVAPVVGLLLATGPVSGLENDSELNRPPSAVATASGTFAIRAEATAHGCKITVKAQNKGSRTTAISRDSQVRANVSTYSGWWRKLGVSVWLDPGQTRSWTYDMTQNCKKTRQYRFLVKQFDSKKNLLNQAWVEYPTDARGWTEKETFSLGDLNRHF